MFVVALLIVGVVVTPLVNSIEYTPQVTIDSGKLQGLVVQLNNTNATVRKYLGIPFAKAERFQPPKQPSPWPESKVKDMITFGKACPQGLGPLGVRTVGEMSEDCLNLNVFVPNENTASPLPVMVWIHGGGFVWGTNRQYDGSYLAVLGKVVVVVINYRLSVFGFLTNGKHGDIKGNYGMLDQIEALKWVKRNIKSFNGDPDKVTIFGESAGGASVSLLMLSKPAKGLFHRAIPQSGDAAAPWATATYGDLANKIKIFAKNVGCPEDLGNIRDCLKSKKLMEIVNASMVAPFPTFIPVIDGDFLEDAPNVLYTKQRIEKIDVMMGVTNDEGVIFTNAIPGLVFGINVTNGLTREGFIKGVKEPGYVNLIIPDPKSVLLDATVYRYTDWTNVTNIYRNRRMYVDLMSDSSFIAPAILAAQAYSKKTATTYFYHLEYRYDGPGPLIGSKIPSWVKAYHLADVMFIFGSMLSNEKATVSANFSREVIKLWTNFAKTGNPNKPESINEVSWPQYTPDEQKYLSLKPDMAVNSHLRADYVAYWNNFIPDALRSTPPCTCMPCGGSADIKTAGFMILVLSIAIVWLL